MSAQWTLGVTVGLPIAAFSVLVCVVAIVVGIVYAVRNHNKGKKWSYSAGWERWPDRYRGLFIAGVALFVAVCITVPCLFGYWPYKAEYHQYRPIAGTVATIGNRINQASTGDTVVTLTSGPQQYDIQDARGSLLNVGDHVSMRCIRVYDYGSNNAGYDCKWGQS